MKLKDLEEFEALMENAFKLQDKYRNLHNSNGLNPTETQYREIRAAFEASNEAGLKAKSWVENKLLRLW